MARMLGLVVVICVPLGLLGGCVSIDKERQQIDEAMWTYSTVEYGPAEPSTELAAIGEAMAPFAPESDEGPTEWAFFVIDDDAVQAFTTIDGQVALTRGLIERLDEDAVAAEVARQMAHARLQHLWGFMNNQISSAGFFIWPKGAASGLTEAKVEYAAWLFHRDGVGFMHPFQTWQLVDADAAAVRMLEGAGRDASGLDDLLALSAAGGTQYAATYGHAAARAKALGAPE